MLNILGKFHTAWQVLVEMLRHCSLQFNFPALPTYFFSVWQLIQHQQRRTENNNNLSTEKQQKILLIPIVAVKLIIVLTYVRTAQFAVLTFTPLDTEARALLWDFMLFVGANANFNFAFIIYGLLCVIFGRLFFLPYSKTGRGCLELLLSFVRVGDARAQFANS